MVRFDVPDDDEPVNQSVPLMSASDMLSLDSDEQRVAAVKRVWQDEDQQQIDQFFSDYHDVAINALDATVLQIRSGQCIDASISQRAQSTMAIFSMIANRIPIATAQPSFIPVYRSLASRMLTILEFDIQTVNEALRESLVATHCYILHALARSFEAFHSHLTTDQRTQLAHAQSIILHSCVNELTNHLNNPSATISPRLAAVTNSLLAFTVIQPTSLSAELSYIVKHLLRLLPSIYAIDITHTSASPDSDKRVLSSLVELTEAVITRCVVVVPRAYASEASIKPPRWLTEDDESEEANQSISQSTNHATYFLRPAHSRVPIYLPADIIHHAINSFISTVRDSQSQMSDELFASGLDLLPLLVALSNAHNVHTHDAPSHARDFNSVTDVCLSRLEQPDCNLSQVTLLLDCVSGAVQLSDRAVILSHLKPVYDRVAALLAVLQSRTTASRTTQRQWAKIRRGATATVLALMYAFDTEFGAIVGWPSFFSTVFPVLASPALPTHALWLLRNERQLMVDVVLPQVMRALIHSQLRTSPTVKTIVAILESIGDAICFTHANHQPADEDPLKPYLAEIVATLLNTLRGSPSSLGVACTQAISRLLYHCCSVRLVGDDDEDGDEWFRECLSSLVDVMDETVFSSVDEASDDDMSDEEVDLVSQARICGIQSTICLMSHADFIESVASSDAAQQVLYRMIDHLVVSIGESPMMFEDDETIMHQQIELLHHTGLSIINHPTLRHKISLIDQMIQLYKSSLRLPEDEEERIDHIRRCIGQITGAINTCDDTCIKQQLHESLEMATLPASTFDNL